jgi:beta-phosphoglucomutase
MLKAVIFDLDGVIVDSHPAHIKAWKIFLQSLGREVTDDQLSFVLEGRKRKDILHHFLGDLSDEQVELYGSQKEALFKDSVPDLTPIKGVTAFLDALQTANIPMGLASSASRSRARYTLDQLNLRDRFQVIVTGDDVTQGKPDPELFRLAAQGLHVEPSDVLVCEDAIHGVQAAKSAGMKCLAIASNGRGPKLKQAGADRVICDFTCATLPEVFRLFE